MKKTAGELAKFLNGQLEGDTNIPISGVSGPEAAGSEDLIFVDAPRHLDRAARSAAKCVLALPGLHLAAKTLISVAAPKVAFVKAATWLAPAEPSGAGIHPTAVISQTVGLSAGVTVGPYAVIEEGVQIGAGSNVGAFCYLGRGSKLGETCRLYPRVTLYPGARLGSRVVVHSGAVIGGDGFGFVFAEGRHWKFPQIGTLEIADDVEIGCNTTVAHGSLGATIVGAGVKIDNLVHVAHNVSVGENSIIAAQTGISGTTTLGKQVTVGGQVGIADHCTIEDGAILGAQAGIPTGKTIRAGQTVWGTPARPLDRFKEQYAWYARLPNLAERLKKLEQGKVHGG